MMDGFWTPQGYTEVIEWAVAFAASLIALVTDLRARRIPNWLTGPLLLAGLVWAFVTGGLLGLGESLAACVALALPFVILFVFAGGGAGDAKLMGALGLWLGLRSGLYLLLAVVLAGALWGLGYALAKGRMEKVLRGSISVVCRTFPPATPYLAVWADEKVPSQDEMLPMPYAVPIFLGVCVAMIGVALWAPEF